MKIIPKLYGVRRNRFSISPISQSTHCIYDSGQSPFVSKREQRTFRGCIKLYNRVSLCNLAVLGIRSFRQPRKSGIDLGGLPNRKKALLHTHQETYRSFTNPKDSQMSFSGLREKLKSHGYSIASTATALQIFAHENFRGYYEFYIIRSIY